MKNRMVYESQSYNNIFMKNSNSEIHLKKINQIKNRENKFFKPSIDLKLNSNGSPFKYSNSNHKRSNSPFDLSIKL